MSRKGSAVRGDPTDNTGNPVLGQDDQEREEISASLNSEAGPGAGPGRPLTLDPAKPIAELVGRIRAHLSPTRGFASGGFRVPLPP